LQRFCDIRDPQLLRLSFLETPKLNRRSRNATVVFLSTYIVGMWQARGNNLDPNACASYIKGKIMQKHRLMKYLLGDKMGNIFFPNVCYLKWSDL